jgi:hypothetical protein
VALEGFDKASDCFAFFFPENRQSAFGVIAAIGTQSAKAPRDRIRITDVMVTKNGDEPTAALLSIDTLVPHRLL